MGLRGENNLKSNVFLEHLDFKKIKLDLIEMQIMVERWDLVTTDFIFHYLMKDILREFLPKNKHALEIGLEYDQIWGAKIHYVDTIPISKALSLDLNTKPISDVHIAVFEVDVRHIQRVANLKVFW